MSACWCDFDNDGNQDIYVANMWSAAGQRVSEQKIFHEGEPENIRELYRRHARGNSLYRNQGNGKFQNISDKAGVEMGRWAWSSDAWDFDHDGYSDLYIANGYISGPDPRDVSSFFWRQVVGKSPQNSNPSLQATNRDGAPSTNWSARTLHGLVPRETFSMPITGMARFPKSPVQSVWTSRTTAVRLFSPTWTTTGGSKSS